MLGVSGWRRGPQGRCDDDDAFMQSRRGPLLRGVWGFLFWCRSAVVLVFAGFGRRAVRCVVRFLAGFPFKLSNSFSA